MTGRIRANYRRFLTIAQFVIVIRVFLWSNAIQSPTAFPEEKIRWADFVGVVRCEVAGGLVAKYLVMESWKGVPVGTQFDMAVTRDLGSANEFPITLCGEFHLVYAVRTRTNNYTPFSSLMSSPFTRRTLPSDYVCSEYDGRRKLRDLNDPELPALRKSAMEFLSMSPDKQELKILQLAGRKYATPQSVNLHSPSLSSLVARLESSHSTEEALGFIANYRQTGDENWDRIAQGILGKGDIATFNFLRDRPPEQMPMDADELGTILSSLRYRLSFRGITNLQAVPQTSLQEIASLKAQLSRGLTILMKRKDPAVPQMVREELWTFERRVRECRTVEQLFDELERVRLDSPEDLKFLIQYFLGAGDFATLRYLESGPSDQMPLTEQGRGDVAYRIHRRLGLPLPKSSPVPPITAEVIAGMKEKLLNSTSLYEKLTAVQVLTAREPTAVVEALRNSIPSQDLILRNFGYLAGSSFGSCCPSNRVHYLKELLTAADPAIGTASAVYLTFDEPKSGVAALKELAKLPGMPGGWAALTLARRGDKSAVERLLAFMEEIPGNREFNPHSQNLKFNAAVLFSNSAQTSGVPQPPSYWEWYLGTSWLTTNRPSQFPLRVWWQTNESKLQLSDPWLPALAKQRID